MMMPDVKARAKLEAALGRLCILLTALAWSGAGVDGQEITTHNQVHTLPSPTGEALTLTPNDMPDISCSIVEWKNDPPKPTLAVLCPPQDTFAPLHLYLKLSWLKSEDVPLSVRSIRAPAKMLIKIRTNKSIAWVWLGVKEKPGAALSRTWVGFNAVADIALLTLPPKR